MQFLFNRKGQHIANLINQQLHAPNGQGIGYFLENEGIFIDTNGYYLGEVVHENRLLFNTSSALKNSNFGSRAMHGSIGSYGNPGAYGNISVSPHYQDIKMPWMKAKV